MYPLEPAMQGSQFELWQHLMSLMPANCTVMMRTGDWPSLQPIARYLFDPSTALPAALQPYKVERVDCLLRRSMLACMYVVKGAANETDGDPAWEFASREQAWSDVCFKGVKFEGVARIARDGEAVYFINLPSDSRGGSSAYVAFTSLELLSEIALALHEAELADWHERPEGTVVCVNGAGLTLPNRSLDDVILPEAIKHEIVTAATTFFRRCAGNADACLARKRGFLLVGEPGNGKTILCQALVGLLARSCGVRAVTARVGKTMSDDTIKQLYEWAEKNSPALVILEDIESVLNETSVTRSGFLNILDGLEPQRGMLTLATSNFPHKIDPALAHRPSRFDRVWHVPLPDAVQRRAFLLRLFHEQHLPDSIHDVLVERTRGWSMAYIGELKATAAVYALDADRESVCADDIVRAADALSRQFTNGTRNHRMDVARADVGFGAHAVTLNRVARD